LRRMDYGSIRGARLVDLEAALKSGAGCEADGVAGIEGELGRAGQGAPGVIPGAGSLVGAGAAVEVVLTRGRAVCGGRGGEGKAEDEQVR
jgi:hypothetical protein